MPIQLSDLSMYPSQQNTELEAYKTARRAKWDQLRSALADGNVGRAKALINELQAEAEVRARARYAQERG